MVTFWLCIHLEEELGDVYLYKKFEFPVLPRVGDGISVGIDEGIVTGVNHELVSTDKRIAHTSVDVEINGVRDRESFKHFWSTDEDWVRYPHN